MIRLPVVGVDPGSRETGLVLRVGDELVEHALAVRHTQGLPGKDYLAAVVDAVVAIRGPLHNAAIALDGVKPPNPHMGTTNPAGIIGTALVCGALMQAFPDAIVLSPDRAGAGPIIAYPLPLRPTRGKGSGRDILRHCRSAWDVAGAALLSVRLGAA